MGKIADFPLLKCKLQRTDIFRKIDMGIGDHDAEKMMSFDKERCGIIEKTALVGSKYACVQYWK